MKKVLLLLALSLTVFYASAQDDAKDWTVRHWTFGPKLGVNFSNLSLNDLNGVSVDNPMRVGFEIGAFATYHSPSFWGLQAELLYSMQGTGIKFNGEKGHIRMDYLNIPLLWKAYVFTEGFAFNIGPQIGFLVNKDFADNAVELKDGMEFRSMDFALTLGASYDFRFGLTLDLRYNIGFVDAIKSYDGFKPKSKNGVLQISAAFNF